MMPINMPECVWWRDLIHSALDGLLLTEDCPQTIHLAYTVNNSLLLDTQVH